MTVDGHNGGLTPKHKMWTRAKRKAEANSLSFYLNSIDFTIPGHCHVFELLLALGEGASQNAGSSLNRLDPTKVSIQGNVWVISHLGNRIKNNASLDQF